MDYPISVPSIGLVGGKFVDEDPLAGTPGSLIPAQWGNAVTDEVLNVILAAGLVPDESNNAQLVAAIRLLNKQPVLLNDTGVANAYTAVNSPALTALPPKGFIQRLVIANANTGASTYAPDGLAAKPIYGLGLQPLQGGELPAGVAVLMYLVQAGVNSGNGAWIIIESLGGASQIASATKSQHAVTMGQLYGGLKGLVQFTSNGSFTAPADVIYLSGCGGGGGGGGSNSTSSSASGGGGGGGAGQPAYRVPINVTKGQVYSVTVGAAGGGGAVGTNGGSGSSTVFGSLLTLNPGVGGSAGGAANASASNGGNGATGFPGGSYGGDSGTTQPSGAGGGAGASGPFGGGGRSTKGAAAAAVPGGPAYGYGAGGGGAGGITSGVTAAGAAGGAGAPGILIIEW